MPKGGIELGTFCSRERRMNRSATPPQKSFVVNFREKSGITTLIAPARIDPEIDAEGAYH